VLNCFDLTSMLSMRASKALGSNVSVLT
jgi:hypothetical protein